MKDRKVPTGFTNLTHLPFSLDRGVAHRLAIGLIVLATDNTIEHEWREMFHGLDGVAVFHSRLWNDPVVTPKTLSDMKEGISHAAKLIRPGERIDVMAYGCASGTIVIGEERVFSHIREARADVACTSPVTAVIAACQALGVGRVAMLTPYTASINTTIRDFLLSNGIGVPVVGSFTHENDNEVARIDADSLKSGIRRVANEPGVEAVFVSCTSLRVAHVIEEIEREIGIPVMSSNHAMAWHALRLGGYDDLIEGYGKLFKT